MNLQAFMQMLQQPRFRALFGQQMGPQTGGQMGGGFGQPLLRPRINNVTETQIRDMYNMRPPMFERPGRMRGGMGNQQMNMPPQMWNNSQPSFIQALQNNPFLSQLTRRSQ